MTTPDSLHCLQLIAARSPEGNGVPVDTISEEGIPAGVLRDLQREGLLEFVGGDKSTVCVTDAGRDVLRPQKSL